MLIETERLLPATASDTDCSMSGLAQGMYVDESRSEARRCVVRKLKDLVACQQRCRIAVEYLASATGEQNHAAKP